MLSAARAVGDDNDCESMWIDYFFELTKIGKAGSGRKDVIKSTTGFRNSILF
jgi:hypothetical protein